MSTAKNRQHATMQEIYRRAYRAQEPFVAEYPTGKDAERMKFSLYNATRAIRQGKVEADQELVEALANVMIRVEGNRLILQRRDLDPGLAALAAAAGLQPGEDAPDAIDKMMQESQERLRKKLGEQGKNPYYTRGE